MVHLLGPGAAVFFLCLLYMTLTTPMVNAGPGPQLILAGFCALMVVATIVLYLTGVNAYEPMEEGMKIHRMFRTTFHPWSGFWRIQEIRSLSVVVFRSRKGVIAYSSTSFFPGVSELVLLIHEKSRCRLPG